MNDQHTDFVPPTHLPTLRQRAEQIVSQRPATQEPQSVERLQELLHELEVHQIELEIQNEELRRSQSELEESRNRFADLYDFAPVGYVSLDQAGIIRECNLTAAGLLQVERGRLVGHPLVGYVHPKTKNQYLETVRRCFRGDEGEEVVGETTLLTLGHASVPVQLRLRLARDAETGVAQCRAALIDLSELRRNQETLRAKEELLSLTIAAADVGIWQLNQQTGEYTASKRALQIQGLPLGMRLNQTSAFSTVHPDDRPRVAEALRQTLDEGTPYEMEYRVRLVNESIRWVHAQGKLHDSPRGKELLGLVQDITARKQTEAALHQSDERLRQLNDSLEQRVVERTEVAERRASDLRRLSLELVGVEQRERKRLAQILHDEMQQMLVAAKYRLASVQEGHDVVEQCRAVRTLIDATIDASRSLAVELSPPVLRYDSLEAALRWLGRWYAEHHELEVQVDVEEEFADVPEETRVFLFQAARELLLNVVKHAQVKTARIRLEHGVDQRVVLGVEDSGVGFQSDVLSPSKDLEGGLGLFSLRERVEALGGSLTIDSKPGDGAKFLLALPVTAPPPPSEAPLAVVTDEAEVKEAAPSRRTRILVVDDHSLVREGLVNVLQRESDLEIVGEAANGEEALRMAAELRPEVILMDVSMPLLDGIEATRAIKQRQPGTVIIGLSFHAVDEKAQAMIEAGAASYVCKDRPSGELLAAIRGHRD